MEDGTFASSFIPLCLVFIKENEWEEMNLTMSMLLFFFSSNSFGTCSRGLPRNSPGVLFRILLEYLRSILQKFLQVGGYVCDFLGQKFQKIPGSKKSQIPGNFTDIFGIFQKFEKKMFCSARIELFSLNLTFNAIMFPFLYSILLYLTVKSPSFSMET